MQRRAAFEAEPPVAANITEAASTPVTEKTRKAIKRRRFDEDGDYEDDEGQPKQLVQRTINFAQSENNEGQIETDDLVQ